MIDIKVNNKSYQFPKTITVKDMLSQLNILQSGIAVAINQTIITQSEWDIKKLTDFDHVLIIQATQGG